MVTTPVASNTRQVTNFAELRDRARALGPKRVAVVAPDEVALTAAHSALQLGIAVPVLIGDERLIRSEVQALGLSALFAGSELVPADHAPATAVRMAANGEVDALLKGHLRTDELLHAVLDKAAGLRTGRLLSDVLLYEDTLAGEPRLVGISDGGLNIAPTLEQKREIVLNAIAVMRCLGLRRPKIAIMSATEAVSKSVPSTEDARALTEMARSGLFGEADLFGPLALDCALLQSAAQAKGITHPVAGYADCMVVPNIESGNLLGKAVKYLGGSLCAHVVAGAKVPILIPSRVESVNDKVNSIALGVLFAAG
ncbi:MAG TPA: phosphate acyltransferase [Candidatus Eisenbacteria bacterium]|nr:phosphate acyltransferase [Candidatus Eisenbacteria bacterium]